LTSLLAGNERKQHGDSTLARRRWFYWPAKFNIGRAWRRVRTAWKLQKLVYYSQVWSLVWNERPLFNERIEAWANGPVVPDLYQLHRGSFLVTRIPGGNPKAIDKDGAETID
jgi:hypothetical protein